MSAQGQQKQPFKVVRVPDLISKRAILDGPNAVNVKDLDRLDAEFVKKLSVNYLTFFRDDLEDLKAAFSALGDDRENKAKIDVLYTMSHDIKGQAGSFGYDLITAIADLLCSSIEKMESIGDKQLEVIGFHVEAMRIAEMKKMKGMGGPAGEKLLGGLEGAVAKFMSTSN